MRLSLLLLFLLSLSACAGQSAPDSADGDFLPDHRPMARTLVYECPQLEFITRVGPGEMAIWLQDRYLVLSQVRAASGSKYRESDVIFWIKGDEAVLEVGGEIHRDCRLNPARAPWEDARRRGVDFRAVGNEPGWYLEVRGDQHLLFAGDYGASKYLFSGPERSEDGEQLFYQAQQGGDAITVTVSETPCADTMKGEQFRYTVLVQLNERSYQGCGRSLDHPWE